MMLARNAWAWGKFGAGTPEGQGKEPSAGGYALLGSLGGLFSALTGLGVGQSWYPPSKVWGCATKPASMP